MNRAGYFLQVKNKIFSRPSSRLSTVCVDEKMKDV
jgi:hypothetical protein